MVAPSATPALQVLHALVFDFMNFRTGRLDPSYAAIAQKAGVCVRTVATALARLRELGILNWVRRCAERWAAAASCSSSRAMPTALLPESQWRGSGRLLSRRNRNGGGRPSCPRRSAWRPWRAIWPARCRRWPAIPRTALAAALARLGQAFLARNA